MVVKSDSRREPFNREKLRQGIIRACEKRPIPLDTIDRITAEVEYELQDFVMEVNSRSIGERVLKKLHDLDPVAYVRFASVYRQFADLETFWKELKHLKKAYQRKSKKSENKTSIPVLQAV
jgi:transcriptional repressor NrdR